MMRSISGDSFWPVIVGREQIRLMVTGGNQIEQHDADAQRLGARHATPELVEARCNEIGAQRWDRILIGCAAPPPLTPRALRNIRGCAHCRASSMTSRRTEFWNSGAFAANGALGVAADGRRERW